MEELINDFYRRIDFSKHEGCKQALGTDCVKCSANTYRDGNVIDYSCENKRDIYVTRYLPVHVSEIYEAMNYMCQVHGDEIARKESLTLASFGGGPGTDIYAFNRWFHYRRSELKCNGLCAYRIESSSDWNMTSNEVVFSNAPEEIDRVYYELIANVAKKQIVLATKFDIAILSYLVSELDTTEMDGLIENLKRNKNHCAYIIINDRFEDAVTSKIEKIMKSVTDNHSFHFFSNEHCGFSYPDEIYESMDPKPKILRKSVFYWGELK